MDFYWLYKDDATLILIGYESEVEIARLSWNKLYDIWELSSAFLNVEMRMEFEYGQEDVDKVEKEATESLTEHCKGQIEWWNSQVEMLNNLEIKPEIQRRTKMEHNYENCHNMSCKRKSERLGELFAYGSVEAKLNTIKAELQRKGFEEPKGFSVLEGFVEDSIHRTRLKLGER